VWGVRRSQEGSGAWREHRGAVGEGLDKRLVELLAAPLEARVHRARLLHRPRALRGGADGALSGKDREEGTDGIKTMRREQIASKQ